MDKSTRLLHHQRVQLRELATPQNVARLFQFNVKEVDLSSCSDFYLDPHSKLYTGMQKLLKGWCGNTHFAEKVLHMDFIHMATGYPVYFEHTDNYEDLRARFMKIIERFRNTLEIDKDKVLTIIVDRGIFSFSVFEDIIKTENLCIITWVKGYKKGTWKDAEVAGSFILEKTRNNAEDIKKYSFDYIDTTCKTNTKMRLLKVKATNPKGNTIEIGIYTDDKNRTPRETITLMFSRWIQENDFKYLDKHFGINEITSYRIIPYKKLEKQLEDREMKNGIYKALEMERKDALAKLGKYLVREKRTKTESTERKDKIKNLERTVEKIEAKMKTTEKEVSRLKLLIEENYVRLDTKSKSLMDVIKLIARNSFYKALIPFKKIYNNYRDDHVIFRNLTHSDGLLIEQEKNVEALINPTPHYTPKLRKIIELILGKLNDTDPIMPDGSGRHLKFRLLEKSAIKLAIVE